MPIPLVFQIKITGLSQAKAQVASALAGAAPGGTLGGGTNVNAGGGSRGGGGIGFGQTYLLLQAVRTIIHAFSEVASAAERLSNEILTVQQLSGSSFKEAAGMSALMNVAGVSDAAAMRELIMSIKNTRSVGGRAALYSAGVVPKPGENDLSIMRRYMDALSKMKDSTAKTAREIAFFGSKSTAVMQSLLRMPKALRDIALSVGESIDQRILVNIDVLKKQWALLTETIQDRIIFPMIGLILPPLLDLSGAAIQLANKFGELNDSTGGALAALGLIVGSITAIAGLIGTVVRFWPMIAAGFALFSEGFAIIRGAISLIALFAAGLNPAGLVVGIAAAVIAAITGIKMYSDYHNPKDKTEENTKRAADALDDIRGRMIGGGRNGARIWAESEAEYIIARSIGLGYA